MSISSADVSFWSSRYIDNQTPWDLGQPAPPFVKLLEEAPIAIGKLVVLGSGKGHDAGFFAHKGFEVVGFDYAPEAVEWATKTYSPPARFEQVDIFAIPQQWHQHFDVVVEHTCFCAIPPERRRDYVQSVCQLLKPSGLFIALFYAHQEPDGPPYRTDEAEITDLFAPYFEFQRLSKTPDSIPDRAGQELLAVFQKT